MRVICGAFAVPAAAGLGRRRAVPSFRGHSFSACRPPRPRRVRRLRAPSSSSARFAFVHRSLDSTLSTSHFNPLHVESSFGVSWFADSLQPTELLASLGGPDQAFSAQPTEAFTSELSAESVALLAVGYIYGGIWAPPPTGLSPVGTAASFAARASGIRTVGRLPNLSTALKASDTSTIVQGFRAVAGRSRRSQDTSSDRPQPAIGLATRSRRRQDNPLGVWG